MPSKKISIVLADVDGTLVDSQKRITQRAKAAIQKLSDAGIKFAVTSGRPPRGMTMIADQVKLSAPIAAFNGGMLVDPGTMKVLTQQTLDDETARAVIERIDGYGLDVWVYAGVDWYLRNINAPHREKEERTVQFAPIEVKDFGAAFKQGVAKVVGVGLADVVSYVTIVLLFRLMYITSARADDAAQAMQTARTEMLFRRWAMV